MQRQAYSNATPDLLEHDAKDDHGVSAKAPFAKARATLMDTAVSTTTIDATSTTVAISWANTRDP